MVTLCRTYGVQNVFIDGAHAIGQVKIDVADIGADFYCSNVHKWMFSPTSGAFLYCRKRTAGEAELHHMIASHNYGRGLPTESAWVGTRDYYPMILIADSIDFARYTLDDFLTGQVESLLGEEGWDKERFSCLFSAWNHAKYVAAVKILTEGWGTQPGAPHNMSACLGMIELPALPATFKTEADAVKLRHFLRERFGLETVLYACSGRTDSTLFIRLSVNVYTRSNDIYRLRDAVLQIADGSVEFSL